METSGKIPEPRVENTPSDTSRYHHVVIVIPSYFTMENAPTIVCRIRRSVGMLTRQLADYFCLCEPVRHAAYQADSEGGWFRRTYLWCTGVDEVQKICSK